MFVRLRLRGRGLHENFFCWGLLGGVPSFFRFEGEGDHIVSSDAAAGVRWAAVLGLHIFRPANLELPLVVLKAARTRAVLNARIKDPLARLADGFELAGRLTRSVLLA